MPLNNSLNVAELLRRLGVVGDSLGSAPLLEALRMSLTIGDLSDLVPPVGVPMAGAARFTASGVGTFNKWSLECRSPGGLKVKTIFSQQTNTFDVWVTEGSPFGVIIASAAHNFSFGQAALSLFHSHTPAASVNPADTFQIRGGLQPSIGVHLLNWVGPGEFFNIESTQGNVNETMVISWKEYPAGINP